MAFSHELVTECLQNEQAFCTAACPFNLDIRDFIGKVQQGRFNIAYKTYQYSVGFPGIVSVLCPEPCKGVCPLKDAGGAISLKELEKASIRYAHNTNPDEYNVPAKEKRIAIIGAGISGLACALRLTTRKYRVTIYEKSDRIGGHLHELLPAGIFLTEIEKQFQFEHYTLNPGNEVLSLDGLDFDSIYVATGKSGSTFGLSKPSEGAYATTKPGVFIGGSVAGADTMTAIAHGLNAANAIESWLKIGSMNHDYTPVSTKLPLDAIRIIPSDAVSPSTGEGFTKEEAVSESKRCLKCCCDACVYYSPLMNYFKKFPRRITEEVQITLHPSSLDGAAKMATRLISTCTHCGLCKEVCPKNIDAGQFLLQSHQTMRKQGHMPWAFHEFYLRDMEFSITEAGLARLPAGQDTSRYMFFPGCQLGASNPEYITRSYRFLLDRDPSVSLMLGCCGAPAEWAGDEAIHEGVIENIRETWIRLGKPVAILACPMCKQMFQRYLPEIPTEFLYSFFRSENIKTKGVFNGVTASVYDPCASRHEPELQELIREFTTLAGFQLEPLPMEGKMAECCSYGGHVAITHPPYTENMIKMRVNQKNTPYITYCSNCRDIFASAGKQSWHILDILLGIGDGTSNGFTVTDRWNNRLMLKKRILKEFWKEEMKMDQPKKQLVISPELREKLSKNYILEPDLLEVIENCEANGKKLFTPAKGTFSGHMQIGKMTYWVEYKVQDEEQYELVNGYSHRMKIEE